MSMYKPSPNACKPRLFARPLALMAMLAPLSAAADGPGALLQEAKPYAELRYRYETVGTDGFSKDAHQHNLRSVVGLQSGSWEGFSGLVELEDVRPLGSERYNSLTNGKTQFPAVPDPKETELNQFYGQYETFGTLLRLGRQRVVLDNARFIGDVGWRQNMQTLDGVSVQNSSLIPDSTLHYGYLYKVNRILGDDHPLGDFDGNMHYLNLRHEMQIGTLVGYGYLLDFNNAPTLSSNTFGASLTGERPLDDLLDSDAYFTYRLEYAHQRDAYDNPTSLSESYYRIEPGLDIGSWRFSGGLEVLGGNGTASFQTPLATVHNFNGWADIFITTPAAGLQDYYVKAGKRFELENEYLDGMFLMAHYHEYESDAGDVDYGREVNLDLTQELFDDYEIGLRYAWYEGENIAPDTTKFILTLRAEFGK